MYITLIFFIHFTLLFYEDVLNWWATQPSINNHKRIKEWSYSTFENEVNPNWQFKTLVPMMKTLATSWREGPEYFVFEFIDMSLE